MRIKNHNGETYAAVAAEASEWLIEFRAGDVDEPARLRFLEWLRRSPEHIQAYLEVSSVWSGLPTSDPENRLDIAALVARARAEADVIPWSSTVRSPAGSAGGRWASDRGRLRRPLLAAVAAVLLAVIAFAVWHEYAAAQVYATAIGEQRTIQLPDGSTIELNARSRIKVRLTDARRAVALLDGQALFRVAKDPARPFVVSAGEARVRAVGTEFDVYKKPLGTVVTVVEGRVATSAESAPAGAAPVYLSAGEQITMLPHRLSRPAPADTAAATAWVQKRLMFEETPLEEVAEEFNRYNTRPLTIDDPRLRTLKISGVYSSTDPASLINFLRSQSSIHVIETEDHVRVVRGEAH